MSFSEELLTTTEAAQLTGRSVDAVRAAIYANLLPRFTRNEFGRPLVRRQDLLEWASRRPPTTRDPHDCYERTWEALAEIGPASADELATYLGLHAGNVRKHLVVIRMITVLR